MRSSKPITVTLGKQQASLENHLATGQYESASEVVRAGLRALDREKIAFDNMMREKIRETLDSDKPYIPLDEAFDRLKIRMAERIEAERIAAEREANSK
jgi:antitoxin ParD1/3/4